MKRANKFDDVFESHGQKLSHRFYSLVSKTNLDKYDFTKHKNNQKKVIGFIITAFFILNIAAFIATSGYQNDIAISVTFRKGMRNDFLRGLGSFTIIDGYNSLPTYAVPLGMIIAESIYVYFKKSNLIPLGFKTLILFICYVAVFATFEYYIVTSIPQYMGGNDGNSSGFGNKFIFGFIIDEAFYDPIYAVSVLLNNIICLSLLGYVHFYLAKRPDFINAGYWRKAAQGLIYIGAVYIVYMELSDGFGRPHPYRVKGNDFLNEMQTIDNGKYSKYYDNYIHQNVKNGGGIIKGGDTETNGIYNNALSFPSDTQWPGYKVGATGTFGPKPPYADNFTYDGDFPSGHVFESCDVMNAIMIITGRPKYSRRAKNTRSCIFALFFIWGLDVIFSMLIMQGHGESDMAFSFIGAFPAYFISGATIDLFTKGIPESNGFRYVGSKSLNGVSKSYKSIKK